MSHPETILRTLDGFLTSPASLILYGRAALALGFPSPKPEFEATLDVDAILPLSHMDSIEADYQFWDALEQTNQKLEPQGLYITHLFVENQVILFKNWLDHLVPIHCLNLNFLSLYRPSTEDLILTKMMRVDPQDRADIEFLLARAEPRFQQRLATTDTIHLPDIPEIISAFEENKKWVLSLS